MADVWILFIPLQSVMGKYLIGILLGFALLFSFGGMRGEKAPELQAEMFVSVGDADCIRGDSSCSLSAEYGGLTANDLFSLNIFYLKVCKIPVSLVLSPRCVNFFRSLKFFSAIGMLSARDTPLFEKNSNGQYFHFSFIKISYRYFVYTLRRLLI